MLRLHGFAAQRTGLLFTLLVLTGCGGGDAGGEAAAAGDSATVGIRVADVGFMTPESVLMDTVADVYLVSNINGSPGAEDDNGFISRVTPDGAVENLQWIDGASGTFTLNAPKGMAISGDTLFVADITCLRLFDRMSGEFLSERCVDGATFLNDVAVATDGSILVTDTGVRAGVAGLEPAGTDAIYRFAREETGQPAALAKDTTLGGPNGIATSAAGILVVTFGSGEVLRFTESGEKTVLLPASNRQYDGVIFLDEERYMFSAWGDSSVYMVGPTGSVQRAITGVEAPADIGYDPRRNRVLIPLFMQNAVMIHALEAPATTGM
ncbi:MAG: SMP-30/gluconolactonase/LRE family protein [Longimicrobiales bacterium]